MKKLIIKALALSVCAISQLSCMQNESKGSLNFNTDNLLAITGASAVGGMTFAVPFDEFKGKNILDVIDLNTTDRDNLVAAIDQAYNRREIKKTSYTFDQKQFIAKIIPLYTDKNNVMANFCIQVKEAK